MCPLTRSEFAMPIPRLLIILPPLFVMSCGEKSEEDRLKDLCMTPCEAFVGYIERCSFELGVPLEDYCEQTCTDQADDTTDEGCEDEFEAMVECGSTISWDDAECSEEVMSYKLDVCSEQAAEWAACLESGGGANGWDGSSTSDADVDSDDGGVTDGSSADADGSEVNIEGDEPGECSDGADNDGNGLFDCDDPGCVDSPDCDLEDPDDFEADADGESGEEDGGESGEEDGGESGEEDEPHSDTFWWSGEYSVDVWFGNAGGRCWDTSDPVLTIGPEGSIYTHAECTWVPDSGDSTISFDVEIEGDEIGFSDSGSDFSVTIHARSDERSDSAEGSGEINEHCVYIHGVLDLDIGIGTQDFWLWKSLDTEGCEPYFDIPVTVDDHDAGATGDDDTEAEGDTAEESDICDGCTDSDGAGDGAGVDDGGDDDAASDTAGGGDDGGADTAGDGDDGGSGTAGGGDESTDGGDGGGDDTAGGADDGGGAGDDDHHDCVDDDGDGFCDGSAGGEVVGDGDDHHDGGAETGDDHHDGGVEAGSDP